MWVGWGQLGGVGSGGGGVGWGGVEGGGVGWGGVRWGGRDVQVACPRRILVLWATEGGGWLGAKQLAFGKSEHVPKRNQKGRGQCLI